MRSPVILTCITSRCQTYLHAGSLHISRQCKLYQRKLLCELLCLGVYEWCQQHSDQPGLRRTALTYTNPAIYQVKLTAYNEAGSVAITNTIGVGPYSSFVANTTLGAAPLTANFTTTSVGVANLNWSFQTSTTSTLANPTNVYAGNGANTVTLTVDNGVLTNTLVKTSYIIVASPVAAFTAKDKTTALTRWPLPLPIRARSPALIIGRLVSEPFVQPAPSPWFTSPNAGQYTHYIIGHQHRRDEHAGEDRLINVN